QGGGLLEAKPPSTPRQDQGDGYWKQKERSYGFEVKWVN
nr:hypothetical protein [Tanacetum cinerariifolium]